MKKVYVKTVLTRQDTDRLDAVADANHMTRAECMRALITGQPLAAMESKMAEQLRQARAEMLDQQREAAARLATLVVRALEPMLHESLLIVRELAAERNAQMLTRVAAKLKAGNPSANGGRHE